MHKYRMASRSQAAGATPPPTRVRERTLLKARTLIEALPFIREHRGGVVVIAARGAVLGSSQLTHSFADDLTLLHHAGVRPLVVLQGTSSTRDVVRALSSSGPPAVGLSERNGRFVSIDRPEVDPEGAGAAADVIAEEDLVQTTLADGMVPVVASIAADPTGPTSDPALDAVASDLAIRLSAAKLVSLDDTPGVVGPAGDLLSELGAQEVLDLLARDEVVDAVTAARLESGVHALKGGVGRIHLLDGRIEHALVLELFTPEGIGTMIAPDVGAAT
jgi:acetylglutamate kinase